MKNFKLPVVNPRIEVKNGGGGGGFSERKIYSKSVQRMSEKLKKAARTPEK